MNHAFLRIVQGLFAAALLFQGFEYFQKPEYVAVDMPSINALSKQRMDNRRINKERKAEQRNKLLEQDQQKKPAQPAKPKAAQAPELRLFPKPGDVKQKPAATPENPPVAAIAPAPAIAPAAAPAPAPVPAVEEEHGNVDYLAKGLEVGLFPVGFDEAVAASEDPVVLIIDARDKNLYELGHIPGAKSVPYETASRDGLKGLLGAYTENFSKPTLVYCGDKFCSKAFELSQYLVSLGLPEPDVKFYAEGFSDYTANGGRLENSLAALDTPDTPDTPDTSDNPATPDSSAASGTDTNNPTAILPAVGVVPPTLPAVTPPIPTKPGLNATKVKAWFASKDYFQIAKFVVPIAFLLLGLIALMLPIGAFTWLLRICLAVLFIYAGYLKMKTPGVFAQNIACYLQVPSIYINQIAFILPPLEILAGIALLIPYFRHAGAFLILCMLCMFIGATGMALWQGLEIDCGCGLASKPLEWSKLAKNSIYALGCIALLVYRPKQPPTLPGPVRP